MAEKKIYLHHERNSEAGALTDIQNREIVYASDIDYLLYKTAGSVDRYVLTMSEDALFESGGDIGIGLTPDEKLTIYETTAETSVYVHIINDVTGSTGSDGTLLGINTNGELVINQQESQSILVKTADKLALTIDSSQNATFAGNLLFAKEIRATNTPLDLGTGYADITAARAAQDNVAGYTVILVKPTGASDETYSFTGMTNGNIYIIINDASNLAAVIDGGVGAAFDISITAQQAQVCYYNSSLTDTPGLIAI